MFYKSSLSKQNVFLLIVCILTCYITITNGVKISTPQGKINGVIKKTLNGRDYEAYYGIPYAKPPVGQLRFKDPVPFGTWEDEHDGRKEASECMQKNVYSNTGRHAVVGSEDCLYLNVYTPSSKKAGKYAVMVYIHGGGFTCGSSSTGLYGPDYILDKDVVLVTLNYRLGPLGFASTEDVELPGNYGLKDQVLALKWVQENIASYGGSPKNVTIFGQSAGGASVHYHMVSPLSKGLFHRAIPMSGTSHCPWALSPPGTIKKRTTKLAALVGCPIESSALLAECFRTASSYILTDLLTEFIAWDIDPPVPFTPVIEPANVKNAFLTEDPHNVKTTIPMMTGITSDEGALRLSLFSSSKNGLDRSLEILDDNFNELTKVSILPYEESSIEYDKISNEIKKFYLGDKKFSRETSQQVSDMYTDAWFLQCATSAIRSHQGPANLYYFAQKGPHSTTFLASNSTEYFGVSHSDDLMYLFPMPTYVPTRKFLTNQEKKIVHEMVTMWTNFAIHGDPTPNGKWKKVSKSKFEYLHIADGKFEMKTNLLPERVKFWENLQWKPKIKTKDEL